MQSDIAIETIDTHTAGEPTRIVTGGIDRSRIERGDVRNQRELFETHYDWVRELLMCEPRGHADMFGAVPTVPASPAADLGLFFMDGEGYLDMCGHGTMGAVTALLETGHLEPAETVTVETPAGLVETAPTVTDGRVESVTVRNVDSYVVGERRLTVEVAGVTDTLSVDVVAAGNVFALVDADDIDQAISPENAETFVELGLEIRRRVNENADLVDPITGDQRRVSVVEFYEADADGADRNLVVFGDGQVDRSPCGTGTCAKMTLLHSRDALEVDERYRYESVIGSEFTGRLRTVEHRNGVAVTTPAVTGSAYVIGRHTFLSDTRDELGGFSLSDA
ncbi:proline racemase family protein [Halobiforma nitratireducens]|uniref:Proline racemase n=1 Tax=Halobiforma nitratireducens JCM 10879 TaxID=1227454 RepID=M0L641_9EURY|nr:proline racemase family protein [Halobiforma nitratireducens]EMA27460.1 proline racemase [Halobiforma nitratireducens JCM 10879]